MALSWIKARHTCDHCGVWFEVELKPPYKPPVGWSLFDCALDAVRGGYIVEGQNLSQKTLEKALGFYTLSCSVQGDDTLCGNCTKAADDANPDDPAGSDAQERSPVPPLSDGGRG